jgi:hypothetical protein
VFLLGVWALLLLGAVAFVGIYGSDLPWSDEFDLVPVLTGDRPVTLSWLWSQHNEHRVPLPRLIQLGLHRITGNDFRAGMLFNVLALGGVALAMLWAAKEVRGRSSCADAFFPLVLLQWGQAENLLWSWQVQFVSSVVLFSVLLVIVVRQGSNLTFSSALLAGMCLVLLPLCGGNGLLLMPPLALWLGYAILVNWGSPALRGRGGSLLVLGLVASAMAVGGLYLVGYHAPPHHANLAGRSPAGLWRTMVAFLSMSFGPFFLSRWLFWGLVMAALLLVATVTLLLAWRARPADRLRALGLVAFLAAYACLVLALTWGRGGQGVRAVMQSRYSTFSLPALCGVYFVFLLYGPHGRGLVQWSLCILVLVMFGFSAQDGLALAQEMRDRRIDFENDLRAGWPCSILAERHYAGPFALYPNGAAELAGHLKRLHNAGIGQFAALQDDVAFREVVLTSADYTAEPGTAIYTLKKPQKVYAIRLTCVFATPAPQMELLWRQRGRNDFSEEERRYGFTLFVRPQSSVLIWINDTIDQFCLRTNAPPNAVQVAQIDLLLPATDR